MHLLSESDNANHQGKRLSSRFLAASQEQRDIGYLCGGPDRFRDAKFPGYPGVSTSEPAEGFDILEKTNEHGRAGPR
jgi:hypothetical protein